MQVATDTRKLTGGEWFVCLVGARFDGHAYVEQAAEHCSGIVCDRRKLDEVEQQVSSETPILFAAPKRPSSLVF